MRQKSGGIDRTVWLHGDLLGSASAATDHQGNSLGGARYTPFGAVRIDGNLSTWPVATNQRFTGQQSESNFGLYDYNAHFYDPLIGRFISPDTIVPGAGNPQAFNRYSYGFSNPLKYTDPDGHNPVLAFLGTVAVGAFFGAAIGYVGEAVAQAGTELTAVSQGEKTFEQAAASMSSSQAEASRIGAAVGGGFSGGTLTAIALATKGKGLNAFTYGGVTAVSGSVVEPLAGGIAEERITQGSSFNLGRAVERATDRGFGSAKLAISYGVLGGVMGPIGDAVGGAIEKRVGGRLMTVEGFEIGFDKGRVIVGIGAASQTLKRNAFQQAAINSARKLWGVVSEGTARKADDSFQK